jgi:hypothetical protein
MAKKDLQKPEFSDIEQFFMNNYLLDHNMKFVSQRTGLAIQRCYALIKKEEIRAELDRRQMEIAEKCDITVEMLLNELKRIALYDIKEHVKNIRTNIPTHKPIKDKKKQKEEFEHFIELREFDELDGRAIAEISEKIGKYGLPELKIKTHSKIDALKTLLEWFKAGHGDINNNIQINISEQKGRSAQDLASEYMNALDKT